MQLSWSIYQTRIVRELKSHENYCKKKMQDEKKYSLIAEPRDVIKNNDRARTFP